MNFYLCGFIGTGTRHDPYRPSADNLPPGWSIIDLRPPGAGSSGHCLLGTNGSPTRSGGICYQLGANIRDGVGPIIRNAIGNYLDIDLSSVGDVRDLIRLVLLSGRLDGTRWLPLRPNGNRYEIVLGSELVDTFPFVAGGALAVEPFSYTDGNLDGKGNWVAVSGIPQVDTGAVHNFDTAYFDVARYDVDLGSPDLSTAMTITKLLKDGSSWNFAGLRIRQASGAVDNAFAYECGWNSGSVPEQNLIRFDAGVNTNLASVALDIPSTGNVDINVTAQGTTLTGWMSGYASLSATDSNYSTNQYCGLHVYSESAATDVVVDNWRAGTMYEGQLVGGWAVTNRRAI